MVLREVMLLKETNLDPIFWCDRMYGFAVRRSDEENRPCGISPEFLLKQWHRNRGRCAVTGIRFNDAKIIGAHRDPFTPSIDKIHSGGWYTEDNVRIVCSAANTAMSTWGEVTFTTLCLGRMQFLLSGGNQ